MTQYESAFLAEMLKESIQQGTTPSLMVVSNSMSPLLCSGDQVGLQVLVPSQAQLGQIITFSNSNDPDDLITHRVADTVIVNGKAKIATFSDRTLQFDMPVAHEDVVGLVIWRRRKGHVLDLMSGQGAWLNKKLSRQAREGLRRATGLRLGSSELDSETINRSNEICRRYRKKVSARILWRANYLWASLLTLYTEHLPNTGKEE